MDAVIFVLLFIFVMSRIGRQAKAEHMKLYVLGVLWSYGPQGDEQLVDCFFPQFQKYVRIAMAQLADSDYIRYYPSPGLAPERGKRLIAITNKGKEAFEKGDLIGSREDDDQDLPPGFV